ALGELSRLNSAHFQVTAQSTSGAAVPPDAVRLTNAATALSSFTSDLRAQVAPPVPVIERAATEGTGGNGDASPPLAQTLLQTASPVLRGRPEFQPSMLSEVGFVLLPSATGQLSETTRAVLADRSLDLTAVPLDRLTHQLELDLAVTVSRLEAV